MDGVQLPQGFRAIMRRQFTFYHYIPGIPQNDERLSWLNLEPSSGFEHRNPTPFIEDRPVPSFLAEMKILLKLAKYSGKIQKQMKKACNFIKKEALAHKVFSGEFCKISNNNFFTEHL